MSRARVAALAAAALVFIAFIVWSAHLPAFAVRADVIVSMALGVALLGIMVGAALTARLSTRTMLVVAGVGLACAVLGSALDVVALSDLGKIAFGAGVGYWLGTTLTELTDDLRVIVVLALAAGVFDAASVFLPQGPTHLLLTKAPQTVTYFVVAFPTMGYSVRDAYSGLGTTDVLFFSLYLAAAVGFGLRVRLTLVAHGGLVRGHRGDRALLARPAGAAPALAGLSGRQRRPDRQALDALRRPAAGPGAAQRPRPARLRTRSAPRGPPTP